MKQRVLSMIMALLGIAAGAQAQSGTVVAVGTQSLSNGTYYADDLPALIEGSITYDSSQKLLTLDNAVINVTNGNSDGISTDISGLTIKTIGECVINATKRGLFLMGSITIDGNGSAVANKLEITSSGTAGIEFYTGGCTLTLSNDANVSAEGDWYGIYGNSNPSKVAMTGIYTQLWLKGGTACIKNMDLKDLLKSGYAIDFPVGAKYKASTRTIVDADGNEVKEKWVLFQKGIAIDEENFPDENFRNWLFAQDYGEDGVLSGWEIAGVKEIVVKGKEIANLKGIEFFTALQELLCNHNQLTALDLSKNTALTQLYCYANHLTMLDVSNTALIRIDCYLNAISGENMDAFVESLPDVRGTGGQLIVYCEVEFNNYEEMNAMTHAQVAAAKDKGWSVQKVVTADDGFPDLVDYEGSDPALTIDEENFPDKNFRNWILNQDYGRDGYLTDAEIATVSEISVSRKNIANLKGIEFFTALQKLWCDHNQLTTLDLSKNTALEELYCFANHLTALDLSKNMALKYIKCCINAISGENMDAFVESLPVVRGTGGQLIVYSEVEINNYEEMNLMTPAQVAAAKDKGWSVQKTVDGDPDSVDYEGEDLLTIDETHFPDKNFRNWILKQDYGKDGLLTNAEITAVKSIDVSTLNIANLKGIEFFTSLESLFCYNNQLTSLDVSKNTALKIIDCYLNAIRSENMDAFVSSLPDVRERGGDLNVYADVAIEGYKEMNKMTSAQVAAARDKGWTVKKVVINNNGIRFADFEGVNVKGDLNDDEVVNIADVVILSNAILAGSTDLMYDVNGDKKVDAEDITAIVNIIAGE